MQQRARRYGEATLEAGGTETEPHDAGLKPWRYGLRGRKS